MRISILAGVFLICLSACSLSVNSSAEVGSAIIVSIGLDYENSSVSNLHGTIADALEVALCFSEIYNRKGIDNYVVPMIQKGKDPDTSSYLYPTSENIKAVIDDISVKPEDLIVFYFSGHGESDENGSFIATAKTEGNEYTKLYVHEICRILNDKHCRSTVILDCCKAGGATDYTLQDRDFLQALKTISDHREYNRVSVLASSHEEQISFVSMVTTEDGITEDHSLFTVKLLEALGWVHCTTENRKIIDYNICGYLGHTPFSMTVDNLLNNIMQSWTSNAQTPETNRTDVPVLIIP